MTCNPKLHLSSSSRLSAFSFLLVILLYINVMLEHSGPPHTALQHSPSFFLSVGKFHISTLYFINRLEEWGAIWWWQTVRNHQSKRGPSKQQMLELNMIKLILLRHTDTHKLYNPIGVVCKPFRREAQELAAPAQLTADVREKSPRRCLCSHWNLLSKLAGCYMAGRSTGMLPPDGSDIVLPSLDWMIH